MAVSYNTVHVDLVALQANYRAIQAEVGPAVRVMAVVKADAYGHGQVEVAQALASAGADTFAVAEVEEGIALRDAGITGRIIILLGAPDEAAAEVVGHRLTPVLFDEARLDPLAREARGQSTVLDVHLKIDVGMGRLGILPDQVEAFVDRIDALPSLRLAGVLSHLPSADVPEAVESTQRQIAFFTTVLARIKEKKGGESISHMANSAGMLYHPQALFDMVRPGISLYGCYPDGTVGAAHSPPLPRLQPVMSFSTRVLQVKTVPAGFGISYGHTFVTSRPTRIAVLPVGYDDGYLRRLSNRAEVLIRGQRAPIIGRVCMNACMVDITDLAEADLVRSGDEVVLMGRQGGQEITADEMAGWLETINYEVLCLFGSRNRREYGR